MWKRQHQIYADWKDPDTIRLTLLKRSSLCMSILGEPARDYTLSPQGSVRLLPRPYGTYSQAHRLPWKSYIISGFGEPTVADFSYKRVREPSWLQGTRFSKSNVLWYMDDKSIPDKLQHALCIIHTLCVQYMHLEHQKLPHIPWPLRPREASAHILTRRLPATLRCSSHCHALI